MVSVKRRRVSYLSPTELTQALVALVKFHRSIEVTEVDTDEGAPGPDDFLLHELGDIILKLGSRLGEFEHVDLPGVGGRIFSDHEIESTGDLMLKPDYEKTISKDVQTGNDKLWSSSAMYTHLAMLEDSVDIWDAGATLWTDTFFFRVSAMVPSSHHMILHPERTPPSALFNPSNLCITPQYMYYTAIISQHEIASLYLNRAAITAAKVLKTGLFVFETRGAGNPLSDHIPQALCELYKCAIHLGQHIVRGALTSGRQWQFVILCLNESGFGARYKISEKVEYFLHREPGGKKTKILGNEPDLIASILLRWAQNSFVDIDEDDIFYEFTFERP